MPRDPADRRIGRTGRWAEPDLIGMGRIKRIDRAPQLDGGRAASSPVKQLKRFPHELKSLHSENDRIPFGDGGLVGHEFVSGGAWTRLAFQSFSLVIPPVRDGRTTGGGRQSPEFNIDRTSRVRSLLEVCAGIRSGPRRDT